MLIYEKGPVRIHYEETGSGFPLLVIAGGGLNSTISGLKRGDLSLLYLPFFDSARSGGLPDTVLSEKRCPGIRCKTAKPFERVTGYLDRMLLDPDRVQIADDPLGTTTSQMRALRVIRPSAQ